METPTLRIILENCFTPEQLQERLPGASSLSNIYDEACEAILSEDENGQNLSSLLDRESKAQRSKIQSMKAKELRSGVAFEFLEPGRMYAHVLWALLRDQRLSARSLAVSLAERFSGESPPAEPAVISEAPPMDEGLESFAGGDADDDLSFLDDGLIDEETIEEELAEMTDTLDAVDEAIDNSTEDDIDLDDLLSDISGEEVEEISFGDRSAEREADEDFEIPDEIFDNENVTEDVDSLLATLQSDDETEIVDHTLDDLNFNFDDDIETVEPAVLDDELEDVDFDVTAGEEEIEIEAPTILEEELDEEELVQEPNETESIEQVEELIEEIKEQHLWTPGFDTEGEYAEEEELEEEAGELVETDELALSPEPLAPAGLSITLGGVEISLASLKRACESVFNEPVELVTDANLTTQDKVVVVGKRCGVRILHGPRYSLQPSELPLKETGEPIVISPESLQSALSRIYSESIELIPDLNLLDSGTIVFAGKETGLTMMTNSRTKVPLPQWVESSASEEAAPSQLADDVAELREYIEALQAKITILEQAPPPAPLLETPPEPEPEEEPEEESIIEDEPISVEDIETEELEPIHETELDESEGEDEHDDEIMAAIAAQEAQTQEEVDLDVLAEDDTGLDDSMLDEVDLSDIGLEETEEAATDETSAELDEETAAELSDDLLEGLDDVGEATDMDLDALLETDEEEIGTEELGDIDLDSLGLEEEEEAAEEEVGEETDEESEIGEEELDLSALGLDDTGLGEDLDLSALEGLEISEEGEEGDVEDAAEEDVELDLDILGELDQEESGGGSAQQVFGGEQILLLGGKSKNEADYLQIVEELGGKGEYYASLSETSEGEITEIVDRADLIMTLTAKAVSDPGIVQATNYAKEAGKACHEFHSATPKSVQKQLTKIAQEG